MQKALKAVKLRDKEGYYQAEAKIVSLVLDTKKSLPELQAIEVVSLETRARFTIKLGLDRKIKDSILKNKDLNINRRISYKYISEDRFGKPRFALFAGFKDLY